MYRSFLVRKYTLKYLGEKGWICAIYCQIVCVCEREREKRERGAGRERMRIKWDKLLTNWRILLKEYRSFGTILAVFL